MKAYKKSGSSSQVYTCNRCDEEFNGSDFRTGEAIYNPLFIPDHDPDNPSGRHCSYTYVEVNSGAVEQVWWCGAGCFHHDEGGEPLLRDSGDTVWVCGACGEEYSSEEYTSPEQMAVECCR